MIKKKDTLNLDTNVIREIVEKSFSKAAVDKDLESIRSLKDIDLKEIVESAFTKAAVDKDLPDARMSERLNTGVVRDIVEKAFTKAAVDKDLGAINKLTEKDFKKISEAAFIKAAVDKDLT
ncbi:MAG: hypothetical protein NT166_28460 [Candidatus Aminicenantes bacterium]|nr:hypothetical protein [Candidatus Aminicenantes bacterium]